MNKIWFCRLLLLRQRMSVLLSPSKSPVPAIFQLRSDIVAMNEPLTSVPPFMNQMASWPVTESRHKMSDLPSPSKSLPTMRADGLLKTVTATGAEVTRLPAVSRATAVRILEPLVVALLLHYNQSD